MRTKREVFGEGITYTRFYGFCKNYDFDRVSQISIPYSYRRSVTMMAVMCKVTPLTPASTLFSARVSTFKTVSLICAWFPHFK